MDPRRQSMEPVATYGQALSWLFTHTNVEEWLFDGEPDEQSLPSTVRLVAAMFWVNDAQVIRDLRKLWNSTLSPGNPPFRYKRYAGWRHGS